MGEIRAMIPATRAKWLKTIDLVCLGTMTNDEVIATVGIAKSTFYDWMKTKEFTEAVMQKNIETFKALVPKAIRTVEACLTSSNQKVRLEAAKILLDRTLPDSMDSNRGDTPTTVNIQVNYV